MKPKKSNEQLIEEQSEHDPGSVASASDYTGMFPAMPADQDESMAMEDIAETHPNVVPRMGGGNKRKESGERKDSDKL